MEHPVPKPSPFNANAAYLKAITVFPHDGPPLDLAYLHELRGIANLQLPNNRTQASKSLTDALVRYTRLEHSGGADAKDVGEGVKRINAALSKLQQSSGSLAIIPQSAIRGDCDVTDLSWIGTKPPNPIGAVFILLSLLLPVVFFPVCMLVERVVELGVGDEK